jgi:hypothetical protein
MALCAKALTFFGDSHTKHLYFSVMEYDHRDMAPKAHVTSGKGFNMGQTGHAPTTRALTHSTIQPQILVYFAALISHSFQRLSIVNTHIAFAGLCWGTSPPTLICLPNLTFKQKPKDLRPARWRSA